MRPVGLQMCFFQPCSVAGVQAREGTAVGFYQVNRIGERRQEAGISNGLVMIDPGIKAG